MSIKNNQILSGYLATGILISCCSGIFASSAPRDTVSVVEQESSLADNTSISSNPSAVNEVTGSADLQKYVEKKLGIKNNHGFRFGGLLIGDTNELLSGGIPDAMRLTSNGLLLLSGSLDTNKLNGWKGGLFDVEFLQFNGQSTNRQAGTVQGYNSLPGDPPLNRSELYQLWYRQQLLNDKVFIRIGKSVPTFDFNNVIKPVSLNKGKLVIPAVSGLIYTPLFVNPSLLGVMPGYYNSAYGLTLNFAPIKQWYASYGQYDGNQAQGVQTGLTGPTFNGSYFYIGETGAAWLLGKNKKPGNVAVGVWHQTGPVVSATRTQQGASGYYLFGSQRLWYRHPFDDVSGLSFFYQYGQNNSDVLPMNKYVGGGFTAFGLVPNRLEDMMGVGVALSWLNKNTFSRDSEIMFQGYYQAKIVKDIYLEPAISYIPTPGASPSLPPAWAGTIRAILLF